jgi:flagellar hook assembly protein FlgD
MASLRHLIQIQNMWKRLNQPASRMDQLLFIQHKKLSKKKLHTEPPKRKSFASSTIVYTQIQHNHNHVMIQILPIEHQLLLHKGQIIEDDDDDNVPLGNLIKS